ncbi:MAG: SUMF1/EgtB/PvdO family nonheme iron enzyme [Nitrospirae bacterium]|nr:SUMF1/EgtB/PvdO family nonheme iron enzyme [Nitrospirota bacterium]
MAGMRIDLSTPEAKERFLDYAEGLLDGAGELTQKIQSKLTAKAETFGVHPLDCDKIIAEVMEKLDIHGRQKQKEEQLRKQERQAELDRLNRIESERLRKEAEEANKQELYTCPVTGMEFVLVKGGYYQMGDTFGDGSDDEKPVHKVCVDDFYMGKYLVTQGQWEKVMGNNPSYFKKGQRYPVEQVSWNDVQAYITRLNQQTAMKYRLPTEAEWEYACRSGGKNEKYAGTSNDSELGEYAWYANNSYNETQPVGQKKPNGLGLYDMSGNVWEWVEDIYSAKAYKQHAVRNPIYTKGGADRVLRGGSWDDDPQLVRCSYRALFMPGFGRHGIGFRLVRSR